MTLPTHDTISIQVKKALIQTLNLNPSEQVDANAKLKDTYGLDSMTSLTFLLAVEEAIPEFEVNPDTLEADHLETLNSVIEYVKKQMRQ